MSVAIGERRRLAVRAHLRRPHRASTPTPPRSRTPTRTCSREGIFTGKGLYDVDAFTAALDGRVPENALLSHDLFEGLYARTALVTDVEVVDDYPSNVLAHARRQHRWVRGDWQILRWLFPYVPTRAGLRAQPPAAHLALEDLRQPAPQPARARHGRRARRRLDRAARGSRWPGPPPSWPRWCSPYAGRSPRRSVALDRTSRARSSSAGWSRTRRPRWRSSSSSSPSSRTTPTRWRTPSSITLFRLVFTRRRLLEWETAAAAAARGVGRAGRVRLRPFLTAMAAGPAVALAALLLVLLARRARRAPGGGAHPRAVGRRAAHRPPAQPARSPANAPRSATDDRQLLLEAARKTWSYFETFMGAEDHALPPDNFQEVPDPQRGASDLADEHRHGAALHPRGARPRLHRGAGARPARRRDPHHDGGAGALRGPPLQLVRHAEPGAAPAPLRLDASTAATSPPRSSCSPRGCARCGQVRARAARRRVRERHELPAPLRSEAAAARDRVPQRRRRGPGAARSRALRPPRLGGAARELPRHRQGRPAGGALVPPRSERDERARGPDAPVVERARCSST